MLLLRKLFTPTTLVLISLLWIAFGVWMYIGKGGYWELFKMSDGAIVPDVFPIHFYDDLLDTFYAWGKQGRVYYLRYQYRDFIYPIIYSSLLSGILIKLIRPKCFNVWVVVPIMAMIFDFAENYFLRVLVSDFPNFITRDIVFASIFSSLKWLTVLISFCLIGVAYNNRRKKYLAVKQRYN